MFRWIRSDEKVIQTRYLEMIERELEYYRKRAEDERLRADRANDSLLQSHGTLPTSDVGIQKLDELQQHYEAATKLMQDQMQEVYGHGEEDDPEIGPPTVNAPEASTAD